MVWGAGGIRGGEGIALSFGLSPQNRDEEEANQALYSGFGILRGTGISPADFRCRIRKKRWH